MTSTTTSFYLLDGFRHTNVECISSPTPSPSLSSNLLFLQGCPSSGKSSLLFQYAFAASQSQRTVHLGLHRKEKEPTQIMPLLICPSCFSPRPTENDTAQLKQIRIK